VNILFVNYGDFTTNSLNHIGGFANALTALGHSCVVAVPSGSDSISALPQASFTPALYNDLLANPESFANGRGADIIHAWTPRECVRKFVLSYQIAAKRGAHLVIHLEDNEEHLASSFSGKSYSELRSNGLEGIDETLTDRLSDPLRYRMFLRLADAVTVIVGRLKEFVPVGIPCFVLRPGVSPSYVSLAAPGPDFRKDLGLAQGEKAVVFTGSNTYANEAEMLDLYRAVALMNGRGTRVRLIRTGFNRPEFLAVLTPDLTAHVLDLGFVPKTQLPALLSVADVLVQPGRIGPFNDFRLPSKLPEFLASGRPVVLPPTNIALEMTDGLEALFLKDGSPEDIANCCARIFNDPSMAAGLGKAAAAYARRNFDLNANTEWLQGIYVDVAAKPIKASWDIIRRTSGSDLSVAARDLADALANGGAANGSIAGLAGLAADVADIVSNDDRRHSRVIAARDGARMHLEETVRHLEMQRDLTAQHTQNLERNVASLQESLKAQKGLSDAHIRNLEEKLGRQEKHLKLHKQLTERHIQNLEGRIIGMEKMLRAERDSAASRLNEVKERAAIVAQSAAAFERAANAEHRKLATRIAEMDFELRAREARLKSIINSFSYKLAAPTRDLEKLWRRLFGKSDQGLPPPPPSALPEVEAVATEVPHAISPAASAVVEPASYHYTFNIDHPRSWSTASNKLLILGWCFENSGAPILGIRAHFAGQIYEGIYGSKRLDVLASTGMKQAEYCGIKIDVPTHLGDHVLVVEVQHGDAWHPLFQKLVHVGKVGDPSELSEYEKWCEQHEALGQADLKAIAAHIGAFAVSPLISVLMPVYNPPEDLLSKAIQSVVDQLYSRWELCIADDASTQPHVRDVLERFAAKDERIKVTYRPKNGHICEASNTALSLASGELIALFDNDDVLAPTALYEVAAEVNAHPDAQLIYSDEDKIDVEDRRFDPYFKPDWNPDLNYGQNYLSHLTVHRTGLVRELGGFRSGLEGSQDWDLILRVIERIPGSSIRHIPKLLYHWRAVPGSTALQLAEKSYPVEAARMALDDHFKRLGQAVEIIPVPGDHWRIKYPIPSPPPLVSRIVPTRNALSFVKQAVTSLLEKTDYPHFEIIIVDNGSDDPETIGYFQELVGRKDPRLRLLPYHAPFNYSAINNFAVQEAHGEIIGFLNNDVEAINAEWLSEMVSQAIRPGIGAVGAMLYYPLNTIQHAGVILGLGGVAGHPFKEFPRGDQGQKNRMRLVQNYSAVTAACLLVRRDRFLEVGGFNEKNLPIAFNDVDLCCKLIVAGYRNLWTPYAEFYHHESATRGVEDTPDKKARFQSEVDYMMNTWGSLLMADPAYNPNLTLVGEDFSPAYLSRAPKSWAEYLH
jgi:O-antigen biosynthesis protein